MKRAGLARWARILAVIGSHAAILIAVCSAGRSTTSAPKRFPSPAWEPPRLEMSVAATLSARRPSAPCGLLLPVSLRPAEAGGSASDEPATTSSLSVNRPAPVDFSASAEGCWPGQHGGEAE